MAHIAIAAMTFDVVAARWPEHAAGIGAIDASYSTDRVFRLERGPTTFALREEPVDPPVNGLQEPISAFLDEMRAAAHAVVAVDGNIILGVAAAEVEWNRRVRLMHLYVAPSARRRGVGTALMASVATFAHEQGAWCIWLETAAHNYPSIQFYQRLGFQLCGLDERLYDPTSAGGGDIALYFARAVHPTAVSN
jgi:ribosomal protein S18 acetylase RimI-like enzyme